MGALLRRGLAPCEAPRRAVRRARPSCARAARASAAARPRIAHSRCALRGSPRAFQLGSPERRWPVDDLEDLWFYARFAQRNVYLLLAARACELNASSSRGGCHKTLERQSPPKSRTSTTAGRPALCTTPSARARYANFSVRVATCATDTGHLGLQQLDDRVLAQTPSGMGTSAPSPR